MPRIVKSRTASCHFAVGVRACGVASLLAAPVHAQDPFAADVRTTPWLTAEEERAKLHVPDGFTLTCFVQEPQIWKPLNLAFDARGRLWCTSSTEYPRPVGADRKFVGRDKLSIHEDRDGDGVAETTIVFADDLNLPIGLLPVVDAEGHDGCIVFSVPNIWRLDDLDGDGRADQRTVLYGPFGWERDSHGLNNSFRRGADGWVYACHGYNNVSTVKGRDGHEVQMVSGNSYRFRVDGSRIEKFTSGQVNPFGSAFDERGDLFTADCHTQPITMLLQGACYEQFGTPHDGLGFAPQIMNHLHGSTALCGLAIETGGAFPPEYAGNLFVGNVMSGRVHRDHLEWHGSTPVAIEQPDLVVSEDPWFRPVDLQIGPDGALYVADFYNRIIGHYEVPLDHPGRDRTSGRIWRVAPPGADATRLRLDLRRADVDELLRQHLDDSNLGVRMRALDELTDRGREFAAGEIVDALRSWHERRRSAVEGAQEATISRSDRHAAMQLYALLRVAPRAFTSVAEQLPLLPQRAMLQGLGEVSVLERLDPTSARGEPHEDDTSWSRAMSRVRSALRDSDPFIVRAAVRLLEREPEFSALAPLIDMLARAPAEDAMLRHSIKLALRSQLQLPGALDRVADLAPDRATLALLVDLCLALHGEAVGRFMIEQAPAHAPPERLESLFEHAAREASPRDLPRLMTTVRERFADQRSTQTALLQAVLSGCDRRGVPPDPAVTNWAEALVGEVLGEAGADSIGVDSIGAASNGTAPTWRNAPVEGVGKSANPWSIETRRCADGVEAPFLSSLPRGETRTGTLRSPPFAAPARLVCWSAGHNGETDRAAIPFNKVRVRDAASGALLAEALPPRNDVAQRIEFDLSSAGAAPGAAGRAVVIELVDGNPYDAYAWLAVGRFEPPVVALPARSPAEASEEQGTACTIAKRFGGERFATPLADLLRSSGVDPAVRAAAAAALHSRDAPPIAMALAGLLDDPDVPAELLEPIALVLATRAASPDAVATIDAPTLDRLAARAIEICPSRQQLAVATAWARTAEGARLVMEQVRQGKAAAALLQKPALRDAIVAALPADGGALVETLTKGLPSDDEACAKLVAARRRHFARHGGDAAQGAPLFAKHCAGCHSVGGVGATIGPQLDGIGARGFERVLEDLFDPDRNVDPQFARTNLFLTNGDIKSVLVRRREANVLVYADERGVEQQLPLSEIAKERPSRLSLMPGNFVELLTEEETNQLLAWLIAARR